jgi:hypothetical protein
MHLPSWSAKLLILALFSLLPLPLALGAPAAAQAPNAAPAAAPDPDPWPRLVASEKYELAIHPPQVESWDGRSLRATSAVAITDKSEKRTVYGVVTFAARTRVDKETRLVVIDEFQALEASLPAQTSSQPRLLGFLQKEFNDAVRVVSLDRLEAALAAAESGAGAAEVAVQNDPPKVVFAERPTMLLAIDGAPVWRQVEGTPYARLLNTRPLVLRDAAGSFHLHLFDGWLAAPNLAGPWKVARSLPPGLGDAAKKSQQAQPADLLAGGAAEEVDGEGRPIPAPTLAKGPVPEIAVATEPTELVVFDGPAQWQSIPGTALEFVENTSGNVFRLPATGVHYVLLSGRWFEAPQLAGPWSHVPQEKLAAEFRKIPDESPKENVKASVAGTSQAAEAVIANSIPQTSEVRRADAKFTPTIDGEPRYEKIAGTSLAYVKNSPTPIVRVAPGEYYAVHDGVWFAAAAVGGPWAVATRVPGEIYAIPPSSPLHYVTYVRIYGSTDEVVLVGYTPGYYGTVVSEQVVVYGTGYAYSPWVGSVWYGYPVTYGYGSAVTYTPWNGWAVAFGVGWAWGHWGAWYAPYYPPYWGPYWGYYPYHGYYGGAVVGPAGGWAAWGPGGWAGTTGNIYRHWGPVSSVSRYSGGFNAWTGNAWRSQVGGAYNSRTGTIAAGQRGAVGNIYTGEYAYGGRGVAHNTRTGATVAGGRVTIGDADTGRQATAGRVGGYNPRTGESGSAGWVRGEEGGVARVGDDFYGWKDGSVYKREGRGEWSQVDRSGRWQGVQDGARTRDLDRQYQARSAGGQRYQGYRSSMPRGGGGGGRRR